MPTEKSIWQIMLDVALGPKPSDHKEETPTMMNETAAVLAANDREAALADREAAWEARRDALEAALEKPRGPYRVIRNAKGGWWEVQKWEVQKDRTFKEVHRDGRYLHGVYGDPIEQTRRSMISEPPEVKIVWTALLRTYPAGGGGIGATRQFATADEAKEALKAHLEPFTGEVLMDDRGEPVSQEVPAAFTTNMSSDPARAQLQSGWRQLQGCPGGCRGCGGGMGRRHDDGCQDGSPEGGPGALT